MTSTENIISELNDLFDVCHKDAGISKFDVDYIEKSCKSLIARMDAKIKMEYIRDTFQDEYIIWKLSLDCEHHIAL